MKEIALARTLCRIQPRQLGVYAILHSTGLLTDCCTTRVVSLTDRQLANGEYHSCGAGRFFNYTVVGG